MMPLATRLKFGVLHMFAKLSFGLLAGLLLGSLLKFSFETSVALGTVLSVGFWVFGGAGNSTPNTPSTDGGNGATRHKIEETADGSNQESREKGSIGSFLSGFLDFIGLAIIPMIVMTVVGLAIWIINVFFTS